ncbi:hypothetical protein HN911_14600 [Candidatus Bathyarchaeota archaeon]|nr:hypothetical protein [Candidatus Bathyarchaeota archaeon]
MSYGFDCISSALDIQLDVNEKGTAKVQPRDRQYIYATPSSSEGTDKLL